jgi:UTP-glucose-1-phosphate uridylyltransferase
LNAAFGGEREEVMEKPTLVVMAAGMGSRYGGLKQIDPVGPNGEIIMDYSIYDALKAGFGRVVFIIKKETEQLFREAIGDRVSKFIDTAYVYQELTKVQGGYKVPAGRTKPWGTGHAVLCCQEVVDTPFAVINADDYYGPSSFQILADFLTKAKDAEKYCQYAMVGYILENTLTEHGTVARGVCDVDDKGYMIDIQERTKIKRERDGAKYYSEEGAWIELPRESTVSMNTWGFTPSIFQGLEAGFAEFLKRNTDNILNAEFFLPNLVNDMIKEEKAKVRVLTSREQWYGVTYKKDKPAVKAAINHQILTGVYPERLWCQK